MNQHFRFLGSPSTPHLMAKGGNVLFALIDQSGSIFGNYGPTPYLK